MDVTELVVHSQDYGRMQHVSRLVFSHASFFTLFGDDSVFF